MNPTPGDIRADLASCSAGAASNLRAPGLDDATVRHRLCGALERALAVTTAAGDHAMRACLLTSLQSAITT
jgi:hypothetical protein